MSSTAWNFSPYGVGLTDPDSQDSNCQHSINVTVQRLTGAQSFHFGSFEYVPAFNTLSDAPSITVTPTSTPSPSSSSVSGPTAPGHNRPVGPIIGGVLGGLILIAGTVIVMLLMRRKEKARQPAGNTFATPFIYMDRSDSKSLLLCLSTLYTELVPQKSSSYLMTGMKD